MGWTLSYSADLDIGRVARHTTYPHFETLCTKHTVEFEPIFDS